MKNDISTSFSSSTSNAFRGTLSLYPVYTYFSIYLSIYLSFYLLEWPILSSAFPRWARSSIAREGALVQGPGAQAGNGFHKWGYPKKWWFILENPIKIWMIWGYPYFRKPSIYVFTSGGATLDLVELNGINSFAIDSPRKFLSLQHLHIASG